MNNDKKAKIINFIKDNLINYMYFATILFTVDELKEFERMATYTEEDFSKLKRWEVSLGVKYERPEFDKYINRIAMMNTHIIGPINPWTKMCLTHRVNVLIAFKGVLKYLKPENYGLMNATIDRDIVNDLYEKNKELVKKI